MPSRPFVTKLTTGVLFINLFVYLLVGASLYLIRQQYVIKTEFATQNLSISLNHNISGIISRIDIGLFAVAREAERQLASGGIDKKIINSYISRQHTQLPELNSILLANSDGILFCGFPQPAVPYALTADREHFIKLRDFPQLETVISKPLKGRISGKWIVVIARRINKPDGSFAGAVYGTIELAYFNKLFSSFEIGKHGAISLRDTEQAVIVRYPEREAGERAIGNKDISANLSKLLKTNPDSGTYSAEVKLDGITRTISYSKSAMYPLYIFVGQAPDDYLTTWNRETLVASMLLVLFSLFTVVSARALRKSEEKYTDIFTRAPVGIYQRSIDGGYTYFNTVLVEMFDCRTSEEFVRNYSEASSRWAEPDKLQEFNELLLKNGVVQDFAVKTQLKSGKIKWFSLFAVLDAPTRLISGFTTDITERQKNRELMIQNEKITMVAGLAAGVAHEVNNPLSTISHGIKNLERRFSPSLQSNRVVADELGLDLDSVYLYMERRDINSYLANMSAAVDRASFIVSNMLKFSQESTLSKHMMDINNIIEQSIDLASTDYDLNKKFNFRQIRITRMFDATLPSIPVHVTEIEQVIFNLIKNAAQAMFFVGTENPEISISTRMSENSILIHVKDNGPGMSSDVCQKVFDPFFTTKGYGLGSGLGLSVTQTIITKNHGGTIEVDSIIGKGTCFTVSLPIIAKGEGT